MFERGTGRLWCESYHNGNKSLGETFNTISCSSYLVIGILSLYLNRHYYTVVRPRAIFAHCFWILTGISSAYYHFTLSLFGQIIDELSLIWLVMFAIGTWMPLIPRHINTKHRYKIQFYVSALSVIWSILAFIAPWTTAYILMVLSVPVSSAMFVELNRHKSKELAHLAARTALVWFTGVLMWTLDHSACNHLLKIGFPYMHALWHVAAGLGGYMWSVYFAYLDALHSSADHPNKPRLSKFLALPYVKFETNL